MPKVSTIVPNYNHAAFLKQRMESVLAQTFKDVEIILLDDDSEDRSARIIEDYAGRYKHIRAFFNPKRGKSPFAQWNKGLRKARGKYVWIAESDDYSRKDFLETAVAILDRYPRVGMFYCDTLFVDEKGTAKGSPAEWRDRLDSYKWNRDYLNSGVSECRDFLYLMNTVNNASGVLFRADLPAKTGLADETMKYCGDWLFFMRLLMVSDIYYTSRVMNFCRVHAGSTKNEYKRSYRYLEEKLKVYAYAMERLELSGRKKTAVREVVAGDFLSVLYRGRFPSAKTVRDLAAFDSAFAKRLIRGLKIKISEKWKGATCKKTP